MNKGKSKMFAEKMKSVFKTKPHPESNSKSPDNFERETEIKSLYENSYSTSRFANHNGSLPLTEKSNLSEQNGKIIWPSSTKIADFTVKNCDTLPNSEYYNNINANKKYSLQFKSNTSQGFKDLNNLSGERKPKNGGFEEAILKLNNSSSVFQRLGPERRTTGGNLNNTNPTNKKYLLNPIGTRQSADSPWFSSVMTCAFGREKTDRNDFIILALGIQHYVKEVFNALDYDNKGYVHYEDLQILSNILGNTLPDLKSSVTNCHVSKIDKSCADNNCEIHLHFAKFSEVICKTFGEMTGKNCLENRKNTHLVNAVVNVKRRSESLSLITRQLEEVESEYLRLTKHCVQLSTSSLNNKDLKNRAKQHRENNRDLQANKNVCLENLKLQKIVLLQQQELQCLREVIEDLRVSLQCSDAENLSLRVQEAKRKEAFSFTSSSEGVISRRTSSSSSSSSTDGRDSIDRMILSFPSTDQLEMDSCESLLSILSSNTSTLERRLSKQDKHKSIIEKQDPAPDKQLSTSERQESSSEKQDSDTLDQTPKSVTPPVDKEQTTFPRDEKSCSTTSNKNQFTSPTPNLRASTSLTSLGQISSLKTTPNLIDRGTQTSSDSLSSLVRSSRTWPTAGKLASAYARPTQPTTTKPSVVPNYRSKEQPQDLSLEEEVQRVYGKLSEAQTELEETRQDLETSVAEIRTQNVLLDRLKKFLLEEEAKSRSYSAANMRLEEKLVFLQLEEENKNLKIESLTKELNSLKVDLRAREADIVALSKQLEHLKSKRRKEVSQLSEARGKILSSLQQAKTNEEALRRLKGGSNSTKETGNTTLSNLSPEELQNLAIPNSRLDTNNNKTKLENVSKDFRSSNLNRTFPTNSLPSHSSTFCNREIADSQNTQHCNINKTNSQTLLTEENINNVNFNRSNASPYDVRRSYFDCANVTSADNNHKEDQVDSTETNNPKNLTTNPDKLVGTSLKSTTSVEKVKGLPTFREKISGSTSSSNEDKPTMEVKPNLVKPIALALPMLKDPHDTDYYKERIKAHDLDELSRLEKASKDFVESCNMKDGNLGPKAHKTRQSPLECDPKSSTQILEGLEAEVEYLRQCLED